MGFLCLLMMMLSLECVIERKKKVLEKEEIA
jgi:hypothetical protein